MAKERDVLTDLKAQRSANIINTANWSFDDLEEMISTYDTAKDIAIETVDLASVSILEEKISQLQEAKILKSHKKIPNKETTL